MQERLLGECLWSAVPPPVPLPVPLSVPHATFPRAPGVVKKTEAHSYPLGAERGAVVSAEHLAALNGVSCLAEWKFCTWRFRS